MLRGSPISSAYCTQVFPLVQIYSSNWTWYLFVIIEIFPFIKLCFYFCFCFSYLDVTKTPLWSWLLNVLRWLLRPIRLAMRNLKKLQKMFPLKRNEGKAFLCFGALVAQMWPKAPKKKESHFPPYRGHNIPGISLPGYEELTITRHA